MTIKARLVLLLCVCSTACAESPPIVDNQERISAGPSAAKPSAALTNDYELMKRIEQLQAEIQKLTGKVDEQAYQLEELKKQQKSMYTDFDDRIQNLESKSGSSASMGSGEATDNLTPATGDSTAGTIEPNPSPSSDTQPSIDSGTPLPPSPSSPKAAQVPSLATPTTPPSASTPTPAPTPAATVPEPDINALPASEKDEYQLAYNHLRNGRTNQAITQFNAYVASHPGSAYAPNAQYWLGEAHRVNMDNASARQAFTSVVDKYPSSNKVPDALLKLGYIEMEEKNSVKAKEIFTRITTEFGSSRAAVIAQKKLATLR